MARKRRAARLAVERTGTEGLALRKFVAIFADKFIATRVNYSFMRSDFVFSNVDGLQRHSKVASFRLFTMLTRKSVSIITMQAARHNQHFKPLLELREHYQALCEEYLRQAGHFKEQLAHVNALLVEDTMLLLRQQNHQFVESLMALRSHYQALNEENERQIAHVREQLTHLNALLVDQLVPQPNQRPVSMQASTVDQNPNGSLREEQVHPQLPPLALTEAADMKSDESPKQLEELDETVEQDEPDESNKPSTPALATQVLQDLLAGGTSQQFEGRRELESGTSSPEPRSTSSSSTASPVQTEALPMQPTFPTPSQVTQQQPIVDTRTSKSNNNGFDNANKKQTVSSKRLLASNTRNTKLDVLPQYRGLPKEEAVMQLLQSNAGTILHIDYIVRSLYGELNKSAFKLAKDRVANTLYRGQQKKLWVKVPQQPGCFTLDLKLIDPALASARS